MYIVVAINVGSLMSILKGMLTVRWALADTDIGGSSSIGAT